MTKTELFEKAKLGWALTTATTMLMKPGKACLKKSTIFPRDICCCSDDVSASVVVVAVAMKRSTAAEMATSLRRSAFAPPRRSFVKVWLFEILKQLTF